MDQTQTGASKFRAHLRTSINVDDIANMTKILDQELLDSQNTLNEISNIFSSINNLKNRNLSVHNLDRDAVSKFLEAEPLKLVTPDFGDIKFEGEVDEILATMKKHADHLKSNLPVIESQTNVEGAVHNSEPIDVSQYAASLEQLNKRLAHIRQNLKQEATTKDLNMEEKLETLNQNVKLFKEMTEGNALLSKCSAESGSNFQNGHNSTSQYEEIVNKLLSGINDVTYLRQNEG
ncbi:uncharacterized protein LOC125239843 [Leguminivora glycinivorella]|uniref:uncharacterized protein LOC125239843 n=1 Tax=Leguminivora glycinivorella TaxID=1035111 RepID=UPI00200DA23D|nr:uncharacterized protein LOC125239843 [Leguminivora glycinivorella]